MKRLFGLFVLLSAFALVSCGGNNVAQEKATVEFSIPIADLLAYRNTSSGQGDGTAETMKLLVQVKSAKKYASQVQVITEDMVYDQLYGKIMEIVTEYITELDALYKKYDLPFDKEAALEYMKAAMANEGEGQSSFEELFYDEEAITELALNHPDKCAAFATELDALGKKYSQKIMESYQDESLEDAVTLTFSFKDVEPGQNLIMVDLITRNEDGFEGDSEWWETTLTGQEEINAIAGQNNLVEIELTVPDPHTQEEESEYFNIEFSYEQGGNTVTKTVTRQELEGGYKYTGGDNWEYVEPVYEYGILNGKPCIRKKTSDNSGTWYELKSFNYVLKDDTHFSTGFEITADAMIWKYNEKTGKSELNAIPLTVSSNSISLLELLDEEEFYEYCHISFKQTMSKGSVLVVDARSYIPNFKVIEEYVVEKETIPFQLTLTHGEVVADTPDPNIIPKCIQLYAYYGDFPGTFVASCSKQELLDLSQLDQNLNAYLLGEYKYIDEDFNEKVIQESDNSITIKDAYMISSLVKQDTSVRLIALVGYGYASWNGYTNCYLAYLNSISVENEKCSASVGLTSMGGTPAVFEFWYGENHSDPDAELLSDYTTAAVVSDMDTTYVQYSEVQEYAGEVIEQLFEDGYKYNTYITGQWNGIFMHYQPFFVEKSNSASTTIINENRTLIIEIECSETPLDPTQADQTITFTAKRADGKSLTQEELELITWEAELRYDGKDINDYLENPANPYYFVENNGIKLNDKAVFETSGIYQLYVKATWPLYEGAENEDEVLISSQTFNILIEE